MEVVSELVILLEVLIHIMATLREPSQHYLHQLHQGITLAGSLLFLLERASAASCNFPGVWMIRNYHQRVLSFILASLGFSTSTKDWSPNTVTRELWSVQYLVSWRPLASGGLTLNWSIVLLSLVTEVPTCQH